MDFRDGLSANFRIQATAGGVPPGESRWGVRPPRLMLGVGRLPGVRTYHANDIDAYYDIKDPVCDMMMAGAESWAAATQSERGPSDQ